MRETVVCVCRVGANVEELTRAQMAVRLGCKLYIATNAAGGAQSGMEPGAVMVIRDHVNALRRTPFGGTASGSTGGGE